MRKLTGTVLTLATVGGLALTGCGLVPEDPCRNMPRPSQSDIADFRQGRELEEDVNTPSGWVECEWTGSRWSQDRD